MRKLLSLAIVVALVFSLAAPLLAEDRSKEVEAFSVALGSNNIDARITALKKITRSGLTDIALFDSIKTRLLEVYGDSGLGAKQVDEAAWMCKALASSGIANYLDVLRLIQAEAPNRKIRNYAGQSYRLFESYAERNALLEMQTLETAGLPAEVGRLVKSLRAPDVILKRDAAKIITRSVSLEPKVFDVVNEELLILLRKEGVATKDEADTMAWLCKALGASGDAKHKATLEEVIRVTGKKIADNQDISSQNQSGQDRAYNLHKYAKQSLESLH